LRYIVRGLVGAQWEIEGIDLIHAASVVCRPLPRAENSPFYVEADGELLGTLPAEVRVVPDALTILIPEQ
jgi:diacylglycerol kinase family enzyme